MDNLVATEAHFKARIAAPLWEESNFLYGLEGGTRSCKSQGEALCFPWQRRQKFVLPTTPSVGTRFILGTNTKRPWQGFSRARDLRPFSRSIPLRTVGRTAQSFFLCPCFLAQEFRVFVIFAS